MASIEGLLHQTLQLLTGVKGDDPARRDRDLFTGLGIAAWPLRLVSQLKIPKPGKLDAIPLFQCHANLFKEGFHHVFGLAFVEAHFLEHQVG